MYVDMKQGLLFWSEKVKLEHTCFVTSVVNLDGEKGAAGDINSRIVPSK